MYVWDEVIVFDQSVKMKGYTTAEAPRRGCDQLLTRIPDKRGNSMGLRQKVASPKAARNIDGLKNTDRFCQFLWTIITWYYHVQLQPATKYYVYVCHPSFENI